MSAERRANRRIAVRVPISLERDGRRSYGFALKVNDAGGEISCDLWLEPGERVLLTNVATGSNTLARVLRGRRESVRGTRFRVVVCFELRDGEDFWGPMYRSARS